MSIRVAILRSVRSDSNWAWLAFANDENWGDPNKSVHLFSTYDGRRLSG